MTVLFDPMQHRAYNLRLGSSHLNRPVIDETNLQGLCETNIHGDGSGTRSFLEMLSSQLGLQVTPERRPVEVLVGDRLVSFDYNDGSQRGAIRDFIAGLKLDNEHSSLSVAEIEASAVHDDEFPLWLDVRHDAAE